MAQFIKTPAMSLLAMYMLTQKGSSLEASLLPISSNMGGEWSFVPPPSPRVGQTSFRDLTGFYLARRCRHWTRNYVTKEGKRNARCPLSYYTIPNIQTTDFSHIPIDFCCKECLLSAMRSSGLVFSKEN